mgnify:FL=1
MSERTHKAMITPKQTAETLGIATSTLRRWASEFEPFLSLRTGVKRTYTTDDITTLKRVKDLFAQGLKTEQVREALPLVDARAIDSALITLPEVLQALDALRLDRLNMLERLEAQEQAINELREQLAEQGKPWYQKLFKKQAKTEPEP